MINLFVSYTQPFPIDQLFSTLACIHQRPLYIRTIARDFDGMLALVLWFIETNGQRFITYMHIQQTPRMRRISRQESISLGPINTPIHCNHTSTYVLRFRALISLYSIGLIWPVFAVFRIRVNVLKKILNFFFKLSNLRITVFKPWTVFV